MGGEGKCLGLGVGGNSKEWSACDMKAERWLFQKQKKAHEEGRKQQERTAGVEVGNKIPKYSDKSKKMTKWNLSQFIFT